LRIISRKYQKQLAGKKDHDLVLLYKQNNDPEIVGELYNRYHHISFGVCLKYMKNPDIANDTLLEIFSTLYDLLGKYEISDFKNWFLTVCRNHCLKQLKKDSKEASYTESSENNAKYFMEYESQKDHSNTREKQLTALEQAITMLKPEQKQCVELFFIENKSYFEIVDITKFDLKKVKSYIQNGKRNLQIKMQDIMKED